MSDIIDNLGAQVIQMIGAQDLSGWSRAHDSLVIDAVRTYLSERDELARLRAELAAVNNEFGSETPDWPGAAARVAEVKQLSGRYWREAEELRAELAEARQIREIIVPEGFSVAGDPQPPRPSARPRLLPESP